jgi:hypothetical protein
MMRKYRRRSCDLFIIPPNSDLIVSPRENFPLKMGLTKNSQSKTKWLLLHNGKSQTIWFFFINI